MRYMTLVRSVEQVGPPPAELMSAIASLGEEEIRSGKLVTTGGLGPTALSTRLRLAGGHLTVTDGPFGEAKEVIGGFAIYEVASKVEAVAAARRFLELHEAYWPGWEGEVEVRPVFGADQ